MKVSFLAPDRSLAVDIEEPAVVEIIDFCLRSDRLETGGVLLGLYSPFGDRAAVRQVVGPPSDSIHRRFGFMRGISGLGSRLRRAWRSGEFYVGEWHFHPGASPSPSAIDQSQILAFAADADADYRCAHPVLIIIGGQPPVDWAMSVSVVVDGQPIRLTPQTPETVDCVRAPAVDTAAKK